MAWNFNEIAEYFRQYAGIENLSGAAGFFEWSAEDGFDLSDYPATRDMGDYPPTQDIPANRAARLWIKINSGAWEKLENLAQVTNIGIGTDAALISGVRTTIPIKGWGAKSIGFGYVLGIDTTLDAIHSDLAQGCLLVQCDIATDGTITPVIDWDDPFIQGDLDDINTWMGAHSVTPAQFAAKMGWESPSEGAAWMLANPRKAFLQLVHDNWDE